MFFGVDPQHYIEIGKAHQVHAQRKTNKSAEKETCSGVPSIVSNLAASPTLGIRLSSLIEPQLEMHRNNNFTVDFPFTIFTIQEIVLIVVQRGKQNVNCIGSESMPSRPPVLGFGGNVGQGERTRVQRRREGIIQFSKKKSNSGEKEVSTIDIYGLTRVLQGVIYDDCSAYECVENGSSLSTSQ